MYTPGTTLLKEVRAAFVRKGTTLSAYCRENGRHRPNVTAALTGAWNGPKAVTLRIAVCKDAGLSVRVGKAGAAK